MPHIDAQEIIDAVETWQIKRRGLAAKGGFTTDGLREFAETHSALAKKLISLTGKKDPEFWSAWLELGQQCSTIVVKGRTIADGVDRSSDYL